MTTLFEIDPASGPEADYPDAATAEAALPSGDIEWSLWTGNVGGATINDADPTSLLVRMRAGHQHDGVLSTLTSFAHALAAWNIQRTGVTIDGLAIKVADGVDCITLGSFNDLIVRNCLLRALDLDTFFGIGGSGITCNITNAARTGWQLYNNVIYTGDSNRGNHAINLQIAASGGNSASLGVDMSHNSLRLLSGSTLTISGIRLRAAQSGAGTSAVTASVRNNVALGDFNGGCFAESKTGTGAVNWTAANNGSSDSTADNFGGSGHLVDQVASAWFVDPANDLKLKGGSPGIDAGATIEAITADAYGTPRPQGAGYDIGHHEYVAVRDGSHVRSGLGLGL